MNKNQTEDNKAANWKYLPNITTLFKYLDRNDLIELSKCCKRYRNKLERRVLEKLDLDSWVRNNEKVYFQLSYNRKLSETLENLKIELGSKLKFVNKFTLNCDIDCDSAEIFVKLFPNIKTLELLAFDDYGCCLGEGLVAILEDMKHLEHVIFRGIEDIASNYSANKQIFPKSIKSLKISSYSGSFYDNGDLMIYDVIDNSYTNLYSLSIASNRMLQNLACGLPCLQEVEIKHIDNLNTSKLVEFLKVNPQLRKLKTELQSYNLEIFETILSYQYLRYWRVSSDYREKLKVYNLPLNHSIKYLKVCYRFSAALTFQIINACSNLETLNIREYSDPSELVYSKLERRINILKLSDGFYRPRIINDVIMEVNAFKIFDQIHFKYSCDNDEVPYEKYNFDKLNNYKVTFIASNACNIKLIN